MKAVAKQHANVFITFVPPPSLSSLFQIIIITLFSKMHLRIKCSFHDGNTIVSTHRVCLDSATLECLGTHIDAWLPHDWPGYTIYAPDTQATPPGLQHITSDATIHRLTSHDPLQVATFHVYKGGSRSSDRWSRLYSLLEGNPGEWVAVAASEASCGRLDEACVALRRACGCGLLTEGRGVFDDPALSALFESEKHRAELERTLPLLELPEKEGCGLRRLRQGGVSEHDVVTYAKQIRALQKMGFFVDDVVVQELKRCGGDVRMLGVGWLEEEEEDEDRSIYKAAFC